MEEMRKKSMYNSIDVLTDILYAQQHAALIKAVHTDNKKLKKSSK